MKVLSYLGRSEETQWREYAVVASDRGRFTLNGQRVALLSVNMLRGEIIDVRWPVVPGTWDATDQRACHNLGLTFRRDS